MNEEDLRNVLIKLAKKLNEEEEKLLEEFNSEKIRDRKSSSLNS